MKYYGLKTVLVLFLLLIIHVIMLVIAWIINQFCAVFPAFGIALVAFFYFIMWNVCMAIYKKMPYVPTVYFIFGCFLPILLAYIAGWLTVYMLHSRGELLLQKAFFTLTSYRTNGDPNEIKIIERELSAIYTIVYAISALCFILSTLCSIRKCKNCGRHGFALFKFVKTELVSRNYQESGSTDTYSDVQVTDSSGNSYTGRVRTGSTTTVDEYETRKEIAKCKCCVAESARVKEYSITWLQNIADFISGLFNHDSK